MDARIRPSWLKRSAPLLVTIGTLALAFVTVTVWRACNRREREQRAERAHAADERDDALASTIRTRLRPLAATTTNSVAPTCPASVTGSLELVEQPFLVWLVGDRDYGARPAGIELHTPGFGYLTGSMTADWDADGEPAGEVITRPWGERSFYVVDPWGNDLCFCENGSLFT